MFTSESVSIFHVLMRCPSHSNFQGTASPLTNDGHIEFRFQIVLYGEVVLITKSDEKSAYRSWSYFAILHGLLMTDAIPWQANNMPSHNQLDINHAVAHRRWTIRQQQHKTSKLDYRLHNGLKTAWTDIHMTQFSMCTATQLMMLFPVSVADACPRPLFQIDLISLKRQVSSVNSSMTWPVPITCTVKPFPKVWNPKKWHTVLQKAFMPFHCSTENLLCCEQTKKKTQ
jgi:hypothetical protein